MTKSGYIGVTRRGGRGRPWGSYVYIWGKLKWIGSYVTPEEAARDRDRVAKYLFGREAELNFPGSGLRGCSIETIRERQRKERKRQTTSRYEGVCALEGRWIAYIKDRQRRRVHLGSFPTELEAARAYDRAAERIWGAQARLNLKKRRKR